MSWYEKKWKPVNLKNVPYPMGAASRDARDGDWYSRLVEMSSKRRQKLAQYDQMDNTIDISRALDIMAEDISSDNATDSELLTLSYESDNIKNAQLKIIEKIKNKWIDKTEFEYKLFDHVRETLKYGLVLFEVNKDGSLKKLVASRIEGYVLDKDDDTRVVSYLYNDNADYVNDNGDQITGNKNDNSTNQKELKKKDVDDLLIFKIGDAPMGKSILDDVYRPWKQLQLLEDAVVIYRIVRAPERRLYYIDIGNMPTAKAESYIEGVKNKMRQKLITREGNVDTEYNPQSMQEDIFLATSGEGRGSRVETLSGGDNLGRIEDLQFFNKKLATGLRIPISYLDSYGEDTNGATSNDGRLGSAYIAEMRYAGMIVRMQKRIAKEMEGNFVRYLTKQEVEITEEFTLVLEPPQNFKVYTQNELDSVTLNVYGSADGIENMSKRFAMKRYLQLEEEEILENEQMKLLEKGFDPKDIKELPEHVKYNLLYGDGEAARSWIDEQLADNKVPTETNNFGQEETPPAEEEASEFPEDDDVLKPAQEPE